MSRSAIHLRPHPLTLAAASIFSYIWGFLWVLVLLGLNELLRRQETKDQMSQESAFKLLQLS